MKLKLVRTARKDKYTIGHLYMLDKENGQWDGMSNIPGEEWREIDGLDVRCLTIDVLTAVDTAHDFIEPRAAVAARHLDGCAPCVTDRLQHLNRQSLQVRLMLGIGCVVDAVVDCAGTEYQFLKREIF